jgi:hypothetical protein
MRNLQSFILKVMRSSAAASRVVQHERALRRSTVPDITPCTRWDATDPVPFRHELLNQTMLNKNPSAQARRYKARTS